MHAKPQDKAFCAALTTPAEAFCMPFPHLPPRQGKQDLVKRDHLKCLSAPCIPAARIADSSVPAREYLVGEIVRCCSLERATSAVDAALLSIIQMAGSAQLQVTSSHLQSRGAWEELRLATRRSSPCIAQFMDLKEMSAYTVVFSKEAV